MMRRAAGVIVPSQRASPSTALSSKLFRRVLNGQSDAPEAPNGTNIHWHGKAYATSAPFDSPCPQKIHRKISKEERCAMVENFVDRYRAINAGKFPTITLTKKQVGGSFYYIRGIIQKLKYESKLSPTNKREELDIEKAVEDFHHHSYLEKPSTSTDMETASNHSTFQSCLTPELLPDVHEYSIREPNNFQIDESLSMKNNEAMQDPSTRNERSSDSGRLVDDLTIDASTSGSRIAGETNVSSEALNIKDLPVSICINVSTDESSISRETSASSEASNIELVPPCDPVSVSKPEESVSTDSISQEYHEEVDANGVATNLKYSPDKDNPVTVQQYSSQDDPKLEEDDRNISAKSEDKEPLPQRDSIWTNLKSFADGIINFWRKM